MKLKQIPEDFQVEELTDLRWGEGTFPIYLMTKRSLGTPEAIEIVQRRWNLNRQQISYGGLKDRHAVTKQFITIKGGPPQSIKEEALQLEYLGKTRRPFTPREISGNRFTITMRDLTPDELAKAEQALKEVSETGVANYFDDQRFGSFGAAKEFIAKAWCQGNYERALWLAIADANSHDLSDEKKQKKFLRDNWKNWKACKDNLGKSHRRSIITYLVDHPDDFRGALALIKVDLRGIYLSAFQSAVWNAMLAEWLRQNTRPKQLVDVGLKLGKVPFTRTLSPEQRQRMHGATMPLPSARLKLEPGELQDLIDKVLPRFGLQLREMRLKYARDSFFSKGERPTFSLPKRLKWTVADDEKHPGMKKLTMRFELGRGAYATMLVKRITEC
ncbi:MAG: tRNA pseudouridine(13) synthase TruD [Planctomycetaceae bacterium]|nr:tRNA pseudouridine(13) synthase TruD [Planctomycetaceae bacterium]